jgi:hypothetical protein
MDNITNIDDDNLGGLSLVKFAPLRFFKSLQPVVFNTNCDWITLQATTETMLFKEASAQDDHGGFQNVGISCSVPKIRPEVHAILKNYRHQKCVVQCEDNNGYLRLAGTLAEGLELADQSTTGGAVSDLNGYNIQFTGKQLDPALFL